MSVAALVVAIVSLILAAASLTWQIVAWALTAGRVKLELRHGALGMGGAVLAPVRARGLADVPALRREGVSGPEVLAVVVRNVGRMPVTVERYGVRLRGAGVSFHPLADAIGPDLPHRIEPGESATWMAEMDSVRALVHAGQTLKRGARHVVMTAELASGKIYASDPVRI